MSRKLIKFKVLNAFFIILFLLYFNKTWYKKKKKKKLGIFFLIPKLLKRLVFHDILYKVSSRKMINLKIIVKGDSFQKGSLSATTIECVDLQLLKKMSTKKNRFWPNLIFETLKT